MKTSSLLSSLLRFPEQLEDGWTQSRAFILPPELRSKTRSVVFGMGGSALGPHVISSALSSDLPVPVQIFSHDRLPPDVDRTALVLCVSFSGNTEETLSIFHQARKHGLLPCALTSGGLLAAQAKKFHAPLFLFDPKNFAPEPRYGTGLLASCTLSILQQLLPRPLVTPSAFRAATQWLRAQIRSQKTQAARLAARLKDRWILVMASEHLEGAAHVFQNQCHETAKHFAAFFPLPELHHHLMEGLEFPSGHLPKTSIVCLFESSLYSPKIQVRLKITKEILRKQKIPSFSFSLRGPDRLSQALEAVQQSGFITYFLSQLHGADPLKTPWVAWIKKELEKKKI